MILSDTAIAALSIEEQRAHTFTTPEEAAVVANHDRQDVAAEYEYSREQAEEMRLWLLDQEDDHGWRSR